MPQDGEIDPKDLALALENALHGKYPRVFATADEREIQLCLSVAGNPKQAARFIRARGE